MNKTIISIVGLIILVGLGLLLFSGKNVNAPAASTTELNSISVKISGEVFDLANGKSEKEYPAGGTTKNKLSFFGNPVIGDLDNDGDKDAAILLQHEPGGSGVFYYAVLAINSNGSYRATETMFLGDRIAPQTVEIRDGRAVYNFAERKAGESFSVPPSMGRSVWVHFYPKTNSIGEWVKDFEGEADTSKMNLGMKKWTWIRTEMSDGKVTTPKKPEAFTLTFKPDGTFSASTDCNGVGGSYKTIGTSIEFTKMMSTLMYCEGSQEQEFSKSLGEVGSFMFTSKGELVLMIKYDSGSMIFR